MSQQSFAVLYCRQLDLPLAEFEQHIFRRALYQHARPLTWLLVQGRKDYFRADAEFIEDVGRLTRYEDFFAVALDYGQHYSNGWYPRRVLRLRVSTERMRRLVRDVFKSTLDDAELAGTLAPFMQ